jgi:uncharacterized membrane protein
MKIQNAVLVMLAIFLAAGVIMPLAQADSTTSAYSGTLYTGFVTNGQTQQLGTAQCLIEYLITNGSNYVNVSISCPSYPPVNNVLIPVGQTYYYYNALGIYVYSVDASDGKADVSVSQPSSSSTTTTTTTGTVLTCVTPGETALGGDTVTFPLTIYNNNGVDETYTLTAQGGSSDWSSSFQYAGRNINQVYVAAGSSQQVNLLVATSYDSPLGSQTVTASTGDASLGLSVDITSINQSADVSVPITSEIESLGSSVYYQFSIDNLQDQQNAYPISVTGLPANWYYEYLTSQSSTSSLAEIAVPALTTSNFVLRILPPNSATVGDYNFTAVVQTSDGVNETIPLTLTLSGGSSMSVSENQLAYSSSPGQTFTFPIYVTNSGDGGALTNVYPDITAPSGWVVSSSPNSTNSIAAGSTQTFEITVQSPGDIVASDYDVDVNVMSDQSSSGATDFRITIATSSIIPYVGGGIILVVIVGLALVYRKYGRR